jgi:hypothetical protein
MLNCLINQYVNIFFYLAADLRSLNHKGKKAAEVAKEAACYQ